MISKVYEDVTVTTIQKVKKEVKRERIVKKKVESYEDKQIEQPPQSGFCGRCQNAFKYGDNPKQPDKCPRCVCIRCKTSIMERKRTTVRDTPINRCYSHWYEDTYKRSYVGSAKGWEISYSHLIPKKTPPITKKVLIEREVEVNEVYGEIIEVEVPVSIIQSKPIDVVNITYDNNNNIKLNFFENYKEFVRRFFSLSKYFFKDDDIARHYSWYGTKSHDHIFDLLRQKNLKNEYEIASLGPIDFNEMIVGEKQYLEEFLSVVGFYPNVPAYIQGHPLNMYNNKRKYKPDIEKSINIYFCATMDSKNSYSQYFNRGFICYSIINYLVNVELIKVNLVFIDVSFIQGETCIQSIDFDAQTVTNELNVVYNFLTNCSVLRVMMLEEKFAMINEGKLNQKWIPGFGYPLDIDNIRSVLNLHENDIIIGTPDEMKITGLDLEDDFNNCIDALGLSVQFKEDILPDLLLTPIDNQKPQKISEIIKQRKISKLIHFTSELNIDSIQKNGILPRQQLLDEKIDFDSNDQFRLDKHLEAVCLSVQTPNKQLLKEFCRRYPDKNYKIIEINPEILHQSAHKSEPVKVLFFDYNAASKYANKSENDFNIMFKKEIRKHHVLNNRDNLEDNIPTSEQAEILYFGDVPPSAILNVVDAEFY